MHVVVVSMHVKSEYTNDFINATLENVRESLREKGVVRFDLLRQADDPRRYLLFEVYQEKDDHIRHKESLHYKRWATVVEPMMAEPRTRTIHESVFPQESGWG
jgi:autoinducer 2-degrading protein